MAGEGFNVGCGGNDINYNGFEDNGKDSTRGEEVVEFDEKFRKVSHNCC